jgi:CubicO group peptidase (beta-lactamase class C family)
VWRAGTRTQKIYDGLTSAFWSWSTPLTNQGYQPTAVESYFDGAGNQHYTAVMTLTPGQSGWEATVGVEYAEFTHEWSKWRTQGFKLSQLETYIANGVRYYDGFFVPGNGGDDFVPGTRAQEFATQLSRNTTAGLELVDLDRAKVAHSAADPTLEDKLARGEYPVVSPVWMSQAENYFYAKQGVDGLGYTIALMKDGRLLGASSEGYAKSPIDGGVRLDANAQWDYLSDSKWITSLAAAKVAEEQHIDLNTTMLVKAIAPQIGLVWQNTANPNDFWHITLKQSMTHTSYLQNGGCDNGPALSGWTMTPGPAMQIGNSGPYSYSGFDACFLRIWVEQRTGMTFERYVDTHLFRPNGIHDLDCVKDPEKSEVYEYTKPATPQAIFTTTGYSEPNLYCAADSFKGTPLQMLKILQMVRIPGKLLSAATLDQMRIGTTGYGDEWTFYQSAFDVDLDGSPDAYGYSMSGGRRDAATHIAQFPANPFDSTAAFTTEAYASGIDAVFFANEDPSSGYLIQWSSIKADPNP